jgi:hypothetical protein
MPDADYEDTGGVFFDANGDGYPDLYVVSGGNEYDPGSERYQDRLYLNDGKGGLQRMDAALPQEQYSGSCVASNDFDKMETRIFSSEEVLFLEIIRLQAPPCFYKITVVESLTMLPEAFVPNLKTRV